MFDIEAWSKERVHTVMRELLISFNYMWFLMEEWMKQNCPEKRESEAFLKLNEEFGAYEARRLTKIVQEPGTGVDRLISLVRHSHWCAFEDIEISKLSDRQIRMRTLGCTAQKAARKWGMDHYPCAKGALLLRQGFFGAVDSSAKVERVFTPPDEKSPEAPQDTSCEWVITIGS